MPALAAFSRLSFEYCFPVFCSFDDLLEFILVCWFFLLSSSWMRPIYGDMLVESHHCQLPRILATTGVQAYRDHSLCNQTFEESSFRNLQVFPLLRAPRQELEHYQQDVGRIRFPYRLLLRPSSRFPSWKMLLDV